MHAHSLAQVLPVPGPVWGAYPVRPAQGSTPAWRGLRWRGALAHCRAVACASMPGATEWLQLDEAARRSKLQSLRVHLRRHGLRFDGMAQALGVAAACAENTLGWAPRSTQLMAAAALLDNRMAEMATGEGKTLAIGLAAAVAALAGMPVHVVTANEYLAARDARKLAPFYTALGLSVASLPGAGSEDEKRAVYGHDVVYATAKDLAFDFLRDRLAMKASHDLDRVAAALGGKPVALPTMRGLCIALLDEADSILLDEAEVPLILSHQSPQAARRAFLWQALALARQLTADVDFTIHRADRNAVLTSAGEERLATLAAGLGGPWQRPRYRREAVVVALCGLHACRRDEHYVVRDGRIELLDEVTGRVATGRVWSRGLQTVVALKEGLNPPAETETVAQITFQRFFQRYWRLCGISGTLMEARSELRDVYGAGVVRIPLHTPCRRRHLPPRRFANAQALFDAAAGRAASLQAEGRPVLIGTDSVADSQQMSSRLKQLGIEHSVLNALHDGDEAAIVALAGRAGRVTVATRMAGRGTDIELDAQARAAGGLHVLSCQHNPSPRLDRQLAGRAARHGDPGSSEGWSFRGISTDRREPAPHTLASCNHTYTLGTLSMPAWAANAANRWARWREERRRAALRRSLLDQDLQWERRLSFAGRQS